MVVIALSVEGCQKLVPLDSMQVDDGGDATTETCACSPDCHYAKGKTKGWVD